MRETQTRWIFLNMPTSCIKVHAIIQSNPRGFLCFLNKTLACFYLRNNVQTQTHIQYLHWARLQSLDVRVLAHTARRMHSWDNFHLQCESLGEPRRGGPYTIYGLIDTVAGWHHVPSTFCHDDGSLILERFLSPAAFSRLQDGLIWL